MPIPRARFLKSLVRVPVAGKVIARLDDIRLSVTYHLGSKYLKNPRSVRAFNAERPLLSACQMRIVRELHRHGISMTHFRELFGDDERWGQMRDLMKEFVASDAVQRRLQCPPGTATSAGKDHLVRLFTPFRARIPVDNPWLRLGLDPKVHDVVNSYLGFWAKLHSLNLWYTLPYDTGKPRTHSQRWHRDPEDERMVKVFMYFSEVGDRNGPFQYIPGSCSGGPYQQLWPYRPINPYSYPPQDELEKMIPPNRWVTCVGGAGTIVFCNTSGFHRGGYASEGGRALAFWTFVSPASLWPRQYVVDWSAGGCALRRAARFALA